MYFKGFSLVVKIMQPKDFVRYLKFAFFKYYFVTVIELPIDSLKSIVRLKKSIKTTSHLMILISVEKTIYFVVFIDLGFVSLSQTFKYGETFKNRILCIL